MKLAGQERGARDRRAKIRAVARGGRNPTSIGRFGKIRVHKIEKAFWTDRVEPWRPVLSPRVDAVPSDVRHLKPPPARRKLHHRALQKSQPLHLRAFFAAF